MLIGSRYSVARDLRALRICVVLTTALLSASAHAQSPATTAASAPAAAASGPTIRPEVAPPILAAQQAIAEKKFSEAIALLEQASVVPGLTPYDRYAIESLRYQATTGAGDLGASLRALEAAIATEQVAPAALAATLDIASSLAYLNKDYEKCVHWSRRAIVAGAAGTGLQLRLAQALNILGQHAAAAKELEALAVRQRDAGEPPGEPQLRLQASNYSKLNDLTSYQQVLERLAASYPKPAYWAELLSRAGRQPGFDERLRIDLLRLGMATQAWTQAGPHVELTERALAAGFAAEARQVVDAAFAQGALGQGEDAGAHRALQQRARQQADADRRAAGPDAKALAAMSGQALFNTGYDQFSAGQVKEGLALMEQGLQRGVAKHPDDARLRLGAAYVLDGNGAKARELLAPIEAAGRADGSSALAHLWLLKLGA